MPDAETNDRWFDDLDFHVLFLLLTALFLAAIPLPPLAIAGIVVLVPQGILLNQALHDRRKSGLPFIRYLVINETLAVGAAWLAMVLTAAIHV